MKLSTLAILAAGLWLWQRRQPAPQAGAIIRSEGPGTDPRLAWVQPQPIGMGVRYADHPLAGLAGVPNASVMF